ncbi:MAG TPA: hypothetical protein VF395_20955, partial [Polyangiaceae bacterium]
GTIIEGKATRKAGKVIVEVEAGEIALPADSVVRIEKTESVVSRFETRYAALAPGDAKARLGLADYCRDHDMHARERQLLQEVLDIDAQNAAARSRLGYVKTDTGWVTQADALRAKGLVQGDGQWVSPGEAREMERRDGEAQERARQRDAVDADLAAQRQRLAQREAELEAQQSRMNWQTMQSSSVYPLYSYPAIYRPGYGVYGGFGGVGTFGGVRAFGSFGTAGECFGRPCSRGQRPMSAPGAFDSTSLSVVKVPYRHP